MWKDLQYRKKMIHRLRNPTPEARSRVIKRVKRDWQRKGEGERRVLSRIIGTARIIVERLGTNISKRDFIQGYEGLRAKSTVSIDHVRAKWRLSHIFRLAQRPKEKVDLWHAVKFCKRDHDED
jgi:hypothetical protein